ncbi:LOW QUALITY PROTEIN: uncharacterized protein FYN12_015578 [Phoenicopterus ruber ruber]
MEHDLRTTREFNGSFYQPSAFLMMGIPGLEALHHWISIPFCALYLIALLGNCMILFIIKKTQSLHEPMYYFLSMLAVTDLGLVLCTLPTTLGIFWFNMRRIGFDACLTQMYFIHILSFIESSVLLAMAFDRFIAISHPLRHPSILTKTTVIKIGLAIVLRGMVSLLPIPFLLKRLTYCAKTELSHSFCFHPDIMNLACADIKVNIFYGMIILLSTVGMDFIFIVLSYILIIKTVIGLATKEECLKALNTCVSHICAVLVFFIPMIGLSMIHRFGKNVPPLVNTLVAYTYLIIPPALNPIIYSIKSSHIREALLRALQRKRIPGTESGNVWLAVPFCCTYVISILGNSAILFVTKADRSLPEPMYLLLCMLVITELGMSLSVLPTVLSVLLFDSQEIRFGCLAQILLIHCFSILASGVLWAMAFNRFMAICNPLQCASILTNPRIGVIGLGLTVRSISLLLPLPILLKKVSFSRSHVLAHSCLHPNFLQLPCADIKVNSMGLFVVLATFGLDLLPIILSYVTIIKTVLSITSKEERLKALNTCTSRICAGLIYYIPMTGFSMVYRLGKPACPLIHVLMANIYLLVPPVLNPIIYSVKTKQICRGIHKLLTPRRWRCRTQKAREVLHMVEQLVNNSLDTFYSILASI